MSKVLDAIRKREVAKFRPAPVAKPKKSTKKAESVVEPVTEPEPSVDG